MFVIWLIHHLGVEIIGLRSMHIGLPEGWGRVGAQPLKGAPLKIMQVHVDMNVKIR